MWGVTVQNEPEAAVGWEACLWTPSYQAQFVKDHLGPVLHAEQPGVKIIGFDHNKDHVQVWAKGLYADPEAKKWFAGIGIHWCVRAAPTTRRLATRRLFLASFAVPALVSPHTTRYTPLAIRRHASPACRDRLQVRWAQHW